MRKVFVAGHNGMVGSAIVRLLQREPGVRVVVADRSDLDLRRQDDVLNFMTVNGFDEVYVAAAKVGGISANNRLPADFLLQNLQIQNNLIDSARLSGVDKLLFLGSSCIYPKFAEQPIKEDVLLSGDLEPTNEAYAIAKIAGIKLCESMNRQYGTDFRSAMPTNLYGPGDNYHPENSHVIPGLIRRFHNAVTTGADHVVVWGTGAARREFLHVDDLAYACHVLMSVNREDYQKVTSERVSHINVGFGSDVTIKELAKLIAETVGFKGEIIYDSSKPDGTPKKLLDSSKLKALGWHPQVELKEGLKATYQNFKSDSALTSLS